MTGSAHPAEKSATRLENGVVVEEDYLGTVGLGHVYFYAALQNNVYGLALLLNGDDVGAGGEGPTAHACLDFGQLFGGEASE